MAKENVALEILDEGTGMEDMDGLGCCIYVYLWASKI
ncbi:geopeptide [Geomonas sp. Red51]|nr:geopeptide [Geomonas azotofigens]MBU5613620.1 geopeptide [Geomonas azotofigens]